MDGATRQSDASGALARVAGQLEHERDLRQDAEHQLERTRERLRLALEVNRTCALDYDVLRDRLECSYELAAIEGTALEVLLHASMNDVLTHIHPEDRARVERAVQAAIQSGDELQVEARVLLEPTRRTRWLLARGLVERDGNGRAVRIVGIARDTTARKELEVAVSTRAQGERLRALGEMAGGVAHDLNQSLALITGYSDMARQELTLDSPDLQRVREMVEITARAALEGGHALRGLLTFVRSQEMLAEAERIDMRELLEDVARLTAPRWRDAPQAEGRPIKLAVDAEPDCAVDGSPAALREAITNLIFNAVDALPIGGSIKLSTRCVDDRVLLEVTDTGTGIPVDVQARIFDPFFTTKGERGTGLGLPQVLSIVERHAGSIDVDSQPGRGTTFRISLPVSKVEAAEAEKRAAEREPAPPRRSIRVLVVEDEQQLARMASLVLTQHGDRATVAESGDEAIARLEEEQFDLVISDLGLGPGINGWDLAEAVRTRWPGTRFVLVTGWGAAIDLAEARARGVDRVVAKPYRIADLRQVADDVAAMAITE